ncbi:uncharacterized protein [Typha latifolia]|uniref:uncharacterized protein isoform X1 n=1 Tax=Typha latifolia TaxID=4733 RepID=UPI003C2EF824
MTPLCVRDILAFHKIDRAVFDKLLAHGANPQMARNVVALFMWLDLIGIDVVNYVGGLRNHSTIVMIVAEAEKILNCIRHDGIPASELRIEIPILSSLVSENIDLCFFDFHKDVVVRGLAQVLDGVGALIFDDKLQKLFRSHEATVRAAEEEARKRGSRANLPRLPPELAKTYNPRLVSASEDCRSMFITFSKGFPVGREEIVEYFTEKWGNCIERVMMERTATGITPMYGRIVFTSESFIGLVLNGERLVKFVINGRQLWARKYVPRVN